MVREKKEKSPEVNILVDWSTEPPPLHANFASISSAQDEFAIVFCSLSPSGSRNADGSKLGRIGASVRMNPGIFYRTTVAMIHIWNRWAHEHLNEAPLFIQVDPRSENAKLVEFGESLNPTGKK